MATKSSSASAKKSASRKADDPARKLKASRAPDVGGRPAWRNVQEGLEGHGNDAGGLILLGVGILSALGIYADLTGLFGRGMKWATSALVGWGHLFIPVALIVVGIVVLSRRFPYGYAPRLFFGSLLMLFSITGLVDLIQGAPGITAPIEELQNAGGYVGAIARGPVAAVLGELGAAIFLLGVLFFSCLVIINLSINELGELIMYGARMAWYYIRVAFQSIVTLRDDENIVDANSARDLDLQPTLADFAPEVDEDYLDDELVYDDEMYLDPGGAVDVDLVAEEDEHVGTFANAVVPIVGVQEAFDLGPAATPRAWKLPPANSLIKTTSRELDHRLVEARGRTLEEALRSHGVETRLVGMTVGPTVTRYELELGAGVKVAKVTSLNKDIAYAMAAEDVRILAPIPGKSAIGVEVPNRERQLVSLGDVLGSDEARKARHPLEVAVGRDINGRAVMLNLAETPHILIAGATGAGKSSCVNSMLTSILMRATPDQVRMILIDPKRVEMGQYNGLPHLLTQVVVNPKRAANALQWAVREMDRRYDLLAEVGVRDITGYNSAWDRGDFFESAADEEVDEEDVDDEVDELEDEEDESIDAEYEDEYDEDDEDDEDAEDDEDELTDELQDDEDDEDAEDEEDEELDDDEEEEEEDEEVDVTDAVTRIRQRPDGASYERLPFVVVVVDELNDLMMVAARDVEESICRIAQMARAVGIHLVIATQRPSVDVITGVIKANIPSRLAFAVSTLADSRVILDQPGAERLVGKGDMLLVTPSSSVARRIQGPWVAEDEVRRVVAHWKRQSAPTYVSGVEGDEVPGSNGTTYGEDDDDELLDAAMDLIVRAGTGSTSMLQRKLRVGFARAGRLMDLLEMRGVVGPSEGSKARSVLMTVDELEAMQEAKASR